MRILPLFILLTSWSSAQRDFSAMGVATDSTYGYTDTNPLRMKKGNFGESIGYSYDFLTGLSTTDDQTLKFVQRHTVDNPQYGDSGAPGASGAQKNRDELDKDIFVTSREKDTVTIYVDIYRRGDLRIPVGLKYR